MLKLKSRVKIKRLGLKGEAKRAETWRLECCKQKWLKLGLFEKSKGKAIEGVDRGLRSLLRHRKKTDKE